PLRFDAAYPRFSDGLAEVIVDERAGFIGRRGDFVLPLRFGSATRGEFSEGLVAVREPESRHVGYVDGTGALAITPRFTDGGTFHDGIAPARADLGFCGSIDRRGQWVVEPHYAMCSNVKNGIAQIEKFPAARRSTWVGHRNRLNTSVRRGTSSG